MVATANPLRGLTGDSACLAARLKTIEGPVVPVGRSYGGAVVTDAAAGNPNVKPLTLIAAFAPDKGGTVLQPAAGRAGPYRAVFPWPPFATRG